jgi:hypothetical protein
VASVQRVLAAGQAEWLLVFDNAPSRASIRPFLPPAGRGRVLITSRHRIWPPDQALRVPVLDRQVAAGLLTDRTGDTNGPAAWELARELGGLPLALEHAAAYIQANRESLGGYLSLFRRRRADLPGRGEPAEYSQTLATTWQLAFDDLQHSAPGAVALLRLLAHCAPEAIPLGLLLRPRPGLDRAFGRDMKPVIAPLLEDPLGAEAAIAALRWHSLVSPPAYGRCRCTGWYRPSPLLRCWPNWPRRGGRLPPR